MIQTTWLLVINFSYCMGLFEIEYFADECNNFYKQFCLMPEIYSHPFYLFFLDTVEIVIDMRPAEAEGRKKVTTS